MVPVSVSVLVPDLVNEPLPSTGPKLESKPLVSIVPAALRAMLRPGLTTAAVGRSVPPKVPPKARLFVPLAFPRFADDLAWWMEAARAQREKKKPPY